MSTFIFINHQQSLRASDTIAGKHSFKEIADSVGVNVDKFRADNHIFNSKSFLDDCSHKHQKTDFGEARKMSCCLNGFFIGNGILLEAFLVV